MATMTFSFPPDYPWCHLVIEGDEETNIPNVGRDMNSVDPTNAARPLEHGGNENGSPVTPN